MKKIAIFFVLAVLVVSGFMMRLDSFVNSEQRSIDEFVYYNMASQMVKDVSDYNTIPYGEYLTDKGRPLPRYFFEPLFKHPPVFSLMVMLSMKMFGVNIISAGYVSILLGVLMIPLIYLLGALVYDKRVGLLAAAFLWMDPVSIMTSQKIWMDTPIAFFTLLSGYFFVLGLKKSDWFFILSGIASGLATNTKYTGILITFAVFLFVVFYRIDLFKNRKFVLSLFLPLLLLLPWLYWNFSVYGLESVMNHSEFTGFFRKSLKAIKIVLPFGLLLAASYAIYIKVRVDLSSDEDLEKRAEISEEKPNKKLQYASYVFIAGLFFVLLRGYIVNSLKIDFIPFTTWRGGILSLEPTIFYFGRLIEYFLIYIFAFASLLVFQPNEKVNAAFIRISVIVVLLFFIMWGNFQCRYILSCIAFLILLASNCIVRIYDFIAGINKFPLRSLFFASLSLFIAYAIVKVTYLNYFLSYTNNMCYY